MKFLVLDPEESLKRHVEASWTNWLGTFETEVRRQEEDYQSVAAQILRLEALKRDGQNVETDLTAARDRLREIEAAHDKAVVDYTARKAQVERLKPNPESPVVAPTVEPVVEPVVEPTPDPEPGEPLELPKNINTTKSKETK